MVFSHQNLVLAWNKVKENSGCAGVDCVSLKEFLDCSFAYRPRRSALIAIDRTEALDDLSNENVYGSIERLKRLIRISPFLSQPYRDLAFCYSKLGQYGLAQESYKKGMMLDMEARFEDTTFEKNEEKSDNKPEIPIPLPVEQKPLLSSNVDVSLPKKEETPLVESMLSGCKVINYLVNKAKETHYLNNSERVTLLYTLGLLGQEGKDFLRI